MPRVVRHGSALLLALMLCGLGWTGFARAEHPATATANTLSESEKLTGWKLLFDGKTTSGWRNFKSDKLNDAWQVADGELTLTKAGGGDIVTVDQYDNFELSLEYKISPGGNSGLMFHSTEEADTPWMTGPEIQIQDNVDGHDPQKAGWLYQLYGADRDWATGKVPDATRPANEWNQLQVRISEQQSDIHMNGIRYSSFQKGSKDWNDRVAKSKFASMPLFGKAKKGHISLQDHGNQVSFRNIKIRQLKPDGSGPAPITGTLPVKVVPALQNVTWAGWTGENADGTNEAFRPIVITNAGDGSNRLFVATQQGVIYVLPAEVADDPSKTAEATVFLDLRKKVRYFDRENEEGFLGMAFHPQFKKNGEFFVYYTAQHTPHLSVISRFRVSEEDANRADPDFEEVLLTIPQPAWNHNGGTLAFGPDGYLYIGLGDGGFGNDPQGNGQNLKTVLGKILRIDVDHKGDGQNYAIPADNPFVKTKDAKPEIYALGVRNVWRMAFDRQTGALWMADVGQNLWEEINIVKKGGNYGWNLREAAHPFGNAKATHDEELIDPIWEYDHQVGKSITGGVVYRGKLVPELIGKYLYADYVSGKLWALDYDQKSQKVLGNYEIPSPSLPVITYGEDEAGEVYLSIVTPNGKGIYRFASGK
ncbi:MAG: PQQ-dependent sugar dehydrogenase [Pirellulales bacterium]|nr:PQQ-dependent sugar dehydrogenase [Pirellulales bacterium]